MMYNKYMNILEDTLMYIIKLTKYVKGFELKISKCLTTILFMLPKI